LNAIFKSIAHWAYAARLVAAFLDVVLIALSLRLKPHLFWAH
jgi:hypothetical protein